MVYKGISKRNTFQMLFRIKEAMFIGGKSGKSWNGLNPLTRTHFRKEVNILLQSSIYRWNF